MGYHKVVVLCSLKNLNKNSSWINDNFQSEATCTCISKLGLQDYLTINLRNLAYFVCVTCPLISILAAKQASNI